MADLRTLWIAGTWRSSADPPQRRTRSMAGAMRKMAVYLGLVEDDGYDGQGFDPDDDFEPELDPERERDRRRHEAPPPSHQSRQPPQSPPSERGETARSASSSVHREPTSLSAENGR